MCAEEEELRAAAAGDAEALTELLRRHGPEVRRRLQISPVWQAVVDTADVMQVTYLEAFLHIGQLRARTGKGFRAWLTHLAQNNLRDAIRELERLKRPDPRHQAHGRPVTDSGSTVLHGVSDPTVKTPSRNVAADEWQALLTTAVAQLPPPYADVVRLHDLEGRPLAEVAALVGRSPGAVCMLRARGLDRLREVLGSESGFFSGSA